MSIPKGLEKPMTHFPQPFSSEKNQNPKSLNFPLPPQNNAAGLAAGVATVIPSILSRSIRFSYSSPLLAISIKPSFFLFCGWAFYLYVCLFILDCIRGVWLDIDTFVIIERQTSTN